MFEMGCNYELSIHEDLRIVSFMSDAIRWHHYSNDLTLISIKLLWLLIYTQSALDNTNIFHNGNDGYGSGKDGGNRE